MRSLRRLWKEQNQIAIERIEISFGDSTEVELRHEYLDVGV